MPGHQLLKAGLVLVCCASASDRRLRNLTLPQADVRGSEAISASAADLDEIVRRGSAVLKADWAAYEDYAFTETDETLKNGRWAGKTAQVVFLEGSDYYIPAGTERAQIRAEAARRAAENAAQRQERIAKYRKAREANDALIRDFPDAFTFELTGEETMDGRAAYVLAATPKKRPGPLSTAAKVLSGMKGTVWVDQEGFHAVRVKGDVVTAVPVYGILAKVMPGTHVEFAMKPVTDAVWLLSELTMDLRISKFFFFRSTQVTRSTFTDYRLNAEVVSALLAE